MKTTIGVAMVAMVALATGQAQATMYCGRTYGELEVDPARPYNAVGFLNNGCTASLIGPNHIVAAAHCFEDTFTGAWQTGLRFYPNFHPDRVAADEMHVPHADVIRVVAGSRAGESVLGSGMDWAIARVDHWTDTAGLDLTPLALAPTMPGVGTALSNPAYTRHHFPYDDRDAILWDNMDWDDQACGWVPPNGGLWAVLPQTAPFYDGVNRDIVGCNSRWAAGYRHDDCSVASTANGVVVHDCDTIGGSSGSPLLAPNGLGGWHLIGVGHGGGTPATASSNNFGLLQPTCTPDLPINADNIGPSVERFRNAPRFATNVAVHRSPVNPAATAVFGVDGDSNKVVWRERTGASPSYTSPFSYWKDLGTPVRGSQLSRIAACSVDASARPQVFVVVNGTAIYSRSALAGGAWGAWTSVPLPGGVVRVSDLDAATDASGRCQLWTVATGGSAYVRNKVTDTTWGSWATAATGTYTNVTSLNLAGVVSAAMIDSAGDIWRTTQAGAGWTAPIKLARPAGVTAWIDIDLTWDELGRGFMVATPINSGNALWFVPLYGATPWAPWRFFDTHLWAPGAAAQNAPRLTSVTASRWMEDPAGTTSPVVFATDIDGNVYFVEYARVGAPAWNLSWKSFYHETIAYP